MVSTATRVRTSIALGAALGTIIAALVLVGGLAVGVADCCWVCWQAARSRAPLATIASRRREWAGRAVAGSVRRMGVASDPSGSTCLTGLAGGRV